MLEINDLRVCVDGKEIIKGLSLSLEKGKVHCLMGPNGSGKSTLAHVLMGHPKYEVTGGSIMFDGKDIAALKPNERARLGLFLSFQYPREVDGVSLRTFLRESYNAVHEKKLSILEFKKRFEQCVKKVKLDSSLLERSLNTGFSGGEKKKSEIVQLLTLDPKVAILDETDSGLDIDALRAVCEGINTFKGEEKIVLIITHYKRILELVKPDHVMVMSDGRIVKEGDLSLVDELEAKGYSWLEE